MNWPATASSRAPSCMCLILTNFLPEMSTKALGPIGVVAGGFLWVVRTGQVKYVLMPSLALCLHTKHLLIRMHALFPALLLLLLVEYNGSCKQEGTQNKLVFSPWHA